jgi:hypothetical protein
MLLLLVRIVVVQTVITGSSTSQFMSASAGSDGSVYAAGYITGTGTYNFGNNITATGSFGGSNIVLVRYNSFGVAQFAQTVAGGSYSQFNGVSIAADGSVYAAGSMVGTGTYNFGNNVTVAGTNSSGSNIVLVKYNSSGVAQWAQTVTLGTNASQFNGVSVTSDGSVYAAGYIAGNGSYSFGNNVTATGAYSSNNIVLVKYNSSGLAQWARTTTTGNNYSMFISISKASDGSIYAAGYIMGNGTYGFGNGVTATGTVSGAPNVILVKYNGLGEAQWAQTVTAGVSATGFFGVSVASDGSVYAAGIMSGTGTYSFGNNVTAAGTNSSGSGYNVMLVTYNESGMAQWAQTVTTGSSASSFFGVSAAPDGSVCAAGVISGTGTYGFGNSVTATGTNNSGLGYNALLVKYR